MGLVRLTVKRGLGVLILVGMAVYGNGLVNGFVGDDVTQVVNSIPIRTVANIPSFFGGSTFYNGDRQQLAGIYYRPLMTTYFDLVYAAAGPNPVIFHLVQTGLFIANAGLVFWLFTQFFRKPLALGLAAIFLVHPMNSEAAVYISAVQETLFFFWGMLGLGLVVRKRRTRPAVIGGCILLSMLAKESGIVFAAAVMAYEWGFRRRERGEITGAVLTAIAGYVWLRAGAVGWWVQPVSSPIDKLDLGGRLLNGPAIIWFYIKTFLWPLNLAVVHRWTVTRVTAGNFWLPLAGDLAGMTAAGAGIWLSRRRQKYEDVYGFFAILLATGMIIHLQIVPLDMTVAEQWGYVPMAGFLGMAGALWAGGMGKRAGKWGVVLAAVTVAALGVRTIMRTGDWRDGYTLATHDLKAAPEAYDLENEVAYQLLSRGQLQAALVHAKKSVALFPYVTNYNVLGLVYFGLGEDNQAKAAYEQALKWGDYYLVYEDMAALSLVRGADTGIDANFVRLALTKFPDDAKLWMILAMREEQDQATGEARAAINRAAALEPGAADVAAVRTMIEEGNPLQVDFNLGGIY